MPYCINFSVICNNKNIFKCINKTGPDIWECYTGTEKHESLISAAKVKKCLGKTSENISSELWGYSTLNTLST